MEKYELVNKFGNNTCIIIEKEKSYNLNNIPKENYLSVVGLVIINNNNQVLLQKRSKNKKVNSGKWGICGGKVNLGETKKDAVIRETFEEIGIKINKEELLPLTQKVCDEYKCYFTTYNIYKNVNINRVYNKKR